MVAGRGIYVDEIKCETALLGNLNLRQMWFSSVVAARESARKRSIRMYQTRTSVTGGELLAGFTLKEGAPKFWQGILQLIVYAVKSCTGDRESRREVNIS
jgi:hypothetical protein